MPGPNFPYTTLDFQHVLKQSFDESKDRLRVDAAVTLDAASEITISHENDSIKIGDGTDFLEVNSDGSLNVITSPGSTVAISKHLVSFTNLDSTTIDGDDLLLNYNTLFTYNNTFSDLKLIACKIKADTYGSFRIKVNGTIIDYFQTSPFIRNAFFKFEEHLGLNNTDIITFEFRPDRVTLDSYDFFLRMEGYRE